MRSRSRASSCQRAPRRVQPDAPAGGDGYHPSTAGALVHRPGLTTEQAGEMAGEGGGHTDQI
jgi:hypothetical protein